MGLQILLTPRDCICPSKTYTCEVNAGIVIEWLATTTSDDDLELSVTSGTDELYIDSYGFQVTIRRLGGGTYTSTLHVRDLGLNGTNLTCQSSYLKNFEAVSMRKTISICIVGNNSFLNQAVDITIPQVQPHLPLVCQWCGTPHQQWSVSSLQCMEESVWSTMWPLLSVKRGMSHAMSAVEKAVSTAAFLSREMPMTTCSVSMV